MCSAWADDGKNISWGSFLFQKDLWWKVQWRNLRLNADIVIIGGNLKAVLCRYRLRWKWHPPALCCFTTSPHRIVISSSSFIHQDIWGKVCLFIITHSRCERLWEERLVTRVIILSIWVDSESNQRLDLSMPLTGYYRFKAAGNLWNPLETFSVRKLCEWVSQNVEQVRDSSHIFTLWYIEEQWDHPVDPTNNEASSQ